MASAGFAACMGGKSPAFLIDVFQLLIDLFSIAWDCPAGWNDMFFSLFALFYLHLIGKAAEIGIGRPSFYSNEIFWKLL